MKNYMKRYIVFQRDGDDWEQESIPLPLEDAQGFLLRLAERYPDRCYVIMTEWVRG